MSVKWIEFQGKHILYLDYSGIRDKDQMIQMVKEGIDQIAKKEQPSLVLSNLDDTYVSREFLSVAKNLSKSHADKILKQGLVGIVGIKKILFKAYKEFTGMTNSQAFDTVEEAKKWLVL